MNEWFQAHGAHPVDLLALALLVLGLGLGVRRGLSRELGRAVGTLLVLAACWRFHPPLGGAIAGATRLGPRAAQGVAFALVAVAATLVVLLLRWGLGRTLELKFKPVAERVGGGLAGLLWGGAYAVAAFLLLGLMPGEAARRAVTEQSLAGRLVYRGVPPVYRGLEERLDLPPLPPAWQGPGVRTNDADAARATPATNGAPAAGTGGPP